MPSSSRAARLSFGLTAAAVFAGVLIQVLVSAGNEHGLFPSAGGRVFNVFCYFTIQSNVVVGITNLMLALQIGRGSEWFRVFRLTGIVAITVTFIVFHTALSGVVDLEGWAKVADQFLHSLVPALAVAAWLTFGPRASSVAAHLRVLANTALIALLFFALAVGAAALDRRLARPGRKTTPKETEREGFEPSMER